MSQRVKTSARGLVFTRKRPFMEENLYIIGERIMVIIVKPVLRGHLLDKDKVAYKTGDLLKEVQLI